jgi:hypothetical protein
LVAFFSVCHGIVIATATLSVLAVKGEPAPNLVMITTTEVLLLDQIIYSPVIKSCVVPSKPPFLVTIWAASIAFEILIFCMTLYKGIEHARTVRSIANSPILYTLYR